MSPSPQERRETRRLQLDAPGEADLEDLHRIPDAGAPDPSAVRLVHSDRERSDQELTATMR